MKAFAQFYLWTHFGEALIKPAHHLKVPIFALTECPRSEDRMERFACPSPDFRGRYRCIDDRSLCDGFFDCPSREDENPDMCLFYKTVRPFSSDPSHLPQDLQMIWAIHHQT